MNVLLGKNAVIIDAHELLSLVERLYNINNINYLSHQKDGGRTLDEVILLLSMLRNIVNEDLN